MSRLKFKRPSGGMCPYIEVPDGKYYIQNRSPSLLDNHVLIYKPAGGQTWDTGQTEERAAKRAACELIEPGAHFWWDRYDSGWTLKLDEWRYYLYTPPGPSDRWLLRSCYDEETVLRQSVESYREFVTRCEDYINERHGQCSFWE